MKMRPQKLIVLASLASAAKVPRKQQPISTKQNPFGNVLATCPSGYEVCEDGCILSGDNCCNDGTGESCDAGYYCIPELCCPEGEVCDSSPIEDTCDSLELPCGGNCVPCGNYCMPITGTCCSNAGEYCPDFGICTSDGACCYLGDACGDSGGNSTATPTFDSLPTASAGSSSDEDDDNDLGNDFTSYSFSPTSEDGGDSSFPASTPAAQDTGGGVEISFPATQTSESLSSSEAAQPSVTVTLTATVTSTATPSSIPLTAGQDGGYHGANWVAIAGFGVGIVLFV